MASSRRGTIRSSAARARRKKTAAARSLDINQRTHEEPPAELATEPGVAEREDREAGIIKRYLGMPWKTTLPGLGLLGISGLASSLFLKKRKAALKAVEGVEGGELV